ncbi:MAG: flagellar filament capping protein FliD [Nitriliruptoraceae bacterium]
MQSTGVGPQGGIASGMDTEGIIEQLLALERQPIQRIEQQQQELEGDEEAWGEIATKLSSVRAGVDKLAGLDDFAAMTSVSSSNEDAVGATVVGDVEDGSLDLDVEQLATGMQQAAGDRFDGLDAELGDRTLTVTTTVDGEPVEHDITGELGADATLEDLVGAINEREIGVQADALQVADGEYQLVLASEGTGDQSAFEVDATGWTEGFTVTQQAQDARLHVGGVEVERATNTIDDLIDGVELELRSTTADPVTVSTERDVDAAVGAVRELVEATNGALDTLAELSDYDPETDEAGPLQGDPSVARIATRLRDAVSRPIAGLEGSDALASDLGISLTRDGRLELDEQRLQAAFEDDFEATAARLAESGSTSEQRARFSSATSATEPGTYDVEVTQAATAAAATTTFEAPTESRTLRFSQPDRDPVEVELNPDDHDTAEAAAAAIQSELDAAGSLDLGAEADGDELTVATTDVGSDSTFTVEELDAEGNVDPDGDALGLAGEHTGTDIAGTIDGEPADGTGELLRSTAGPSEGLTVAVDGEPAGDDSFTATYTHGLMGELDAALSRAEGPNGLIEQARDSIQRQDERFDQRIEAFERRVASREQTIRERFVAMERALGQFNQQSAQLQQQLAGLG